LLFLVPTFLFLAAFRLVLFVLEALEGLEEGFAALFVEDRGDGYEFASVVPLVVAEEDVQGVEF